MRKKQRLQSSLFDNYVEHEIGNELKNISMILDQHIEVLDWVEKDIQTINLKDESGRKGMSVESILRCAILKQHRRQRLRKIRVHDLTLKGSSRPLCVVPNYV